MINVLKPLGTFIKKNFILIVCCIITANIIEHTDVNYFIKQNITNKIIFFIKFKNETKNMNVKKFENFSVYYSGEEKTALIDLIVKSISVVNEQNKNILGINNSTKSDSLNVVLFTSKDKLGSDFNTETYKYSEAIYGFNTIYLAENVINEHIIIHEYNHYLFDLFCNDKKINTDNIPDWFKEGLAEYSTYNLLEKNFNKTALNKIEDFKKLNSPADMAKAYTNGYDVYGQSYLAINKLVSGKKNNVIQAILIDTKTMNFYDALKKNTNDSIEDIEKLIVIN